MVVWGDVKWYLYRYVHVDKCRFVVDVCSNFCKCVCVYVRKIPAARIFCNTGVSPTWYPVILTVVFLWSWTHLQTTSQTDLTVLGGCDAPPLIKKVPELLTFPKAIKKTPREQRRFDCVPRTGINLTVIKWAILPESSTNWREEDGGEERRWVEEKGAEGSEGIER